MNDELNAVRDGVTNHTDKLPCRPEAETHLMGEEALAREVLEVQQFIRSMTSLESLEQGREVSHELHNVEAEV